MKYGHLTVLEMLPERHKGHITVRCLCDCGTVFERRFDHVRSGRTTSCGCFNIRGNRKITVKNGLCYIPLTKGFTAIADECDLGLLEPGNWFAAVNKSGLVYAHRYDRGAFDARGSRSNAYRLITDAPADMVPDHINGDTLNNRRSNLRVITEYQNSLNRRVASNNTSGAAGVKFRDGAWIASIGVGGKTLHLGRFEAFDLARTARAAAEAEHFGEFARSA